MEKINYQRLSKVDNPIRASGRRQQWGVFLLAVLFSCWWLALAIAPYYRQDWLLENILVFIFISILVGSYKRFRFSLTSYLLFFIFLSLHTLGAHYTYAEVPYGQWLQKLTGWSLHQTSTWQRNHFDRLLHFLYGLLLTYPLREWLVRVGKAKGIWSYLVPIAIMLSTSLLYELVEWAAAILFGGDLGMAYLGTQGDIWDAHKDMGLAVLGTLIASLWIGLMQYYKNRRHK